MAHRGRYDPPKAPIQGICPVKLAESGFSDISVQTPEANPSVLEKEKI